MRIAVALALTALPVASQDADPGRASFVFARDGFCGGAPGSPHASVEGDVLALENGVLRCTWSVEGGALRPLRIEDRITGTVHELDGGEAFRLILEEGEEISVSLVPLLVDLLRLESGAVGHKAELLGPQLDRHVAQRRLQDPEVQLAAWLAAWLVVRLAVRLAVLLSLGATASTWGRHGWLLRAEALLRGARGCACLNHRQKGSAS